MTSRSHLASLCGLCLLVPALTACPPDDAGTASDTQASTTSVSGASTSTGENTTTTGGTTDATTGEPTTSTAASSSTGGSGVSFADVQAIFNQKCSCHLVAPNPQNGMMELTEGKAHDNIVGVKSSEATTTNRVEPGDPSKSYLWLKLNGMDYQNVPGGSGDPMPLGPDLTPEQLATIEEWITAGAPAG